MRSKIGLVAGIAVLLAIAIPAQAKAGNASGVVVAKQRAQGTMVLVRPGGVGLTVHGLVAQAKIGERVSIQGTTLRDGTMRASQLRPLSRVHVAMIRGVVVRQLPRSTLVATGRSVITIRHARVRALASASGNGNLLAGTIGEFQVQIEGNDLFEQAPPVQVGQTGNAPIEGVIVSVTPSFVVSVEGLPITITVPTGMTLPTTLAAGQQIELTVQVGTTPNTFTLVSIDQAQNVNPVVQNEEVEVNGSVVSSTATQIVISGGGATFTFTVPTGTTLPTIAAGTFVEARGVSQNGTIMLTRLRLENGDDGGGGHGGGGGGGDG